MSPTVYYNGAHIFIKDYNNQYIRLICDSFNYVNTTIKNIINNKNNDKDKIISLFNTNIKGKKYVKQVGCSHGSEGHWLEKCMGIKPNSNNIPDIYGYEMKKDSKKISFGDFSGEYLFSNKRDTLTKINNINIKLTREDFIKLFGNKSTRKLNRYSWSGSCIPKYGKWNDNGQILDIDTSNNIVIYYLSTNDKRNIDIPDNLKNKKICIVVWSFIKMKEFIENKFNEKGFFLCKKDKNNNYNKISFGKCITYDIFLDKIKSGEIFFDSGMYHDILKPNNRNYSQWRANNTFWHSMIIEEYS